MEWEAEQAEKEAARANRVSAQSLNAPIDAEVLGRAIIVTSSERDQPTAETATEEAITTDTANSKKHAKLSQHSEGSWETCDEENDDASSADGDAHEDDANESVLEAPEIADEYVEDDYFDDGLQLHDQSPVAAALPLPSDADADLGSLQRSPRDPDDDSNTRDDHNSSAESLERFIVQHTLRIDDETGCSFEAGAGVAPADDDDDNTETGATVSAADSVDSKTLAEDVGEDEQQASAAAAESHSRTSAEIEAPSDAVKCDEAESERASQISDPSVDDSSTTCDALADQESHVAAQETPLTSQDSTPDSDHASDAGESPESEKSSKDLESHS